MFKVLGLGVFIIGIRFLGFRPLSVGLGVREFGIPKTDFNIGGSEILYLESSDSKDALSLSSPSSSCRAGAAPCATTASDDAEWLVRVGLASADQ